MLEARVTTGNMFVVLLGSVEIAEVWHMFLLLGRYQIILDGPGLERKDEGFGILVLLLFCRLFGHSMTLI